MFLFKELKKKTINFLPSKPSKARLTKIKRVDAILPPTGLYFVQHCWTGARNGELQKGEWKRVSWSHSSNKSIWIQKPLQKNNKTHKFKC